MKVDEVYSEPSLSEMLDISRTPVREALQDLAVEGYVQAIPKRGYQVISFESYKIDHLYEYRLSIELAIINQVCVTIKPHQLLEIENILHADHLAAENEDVATSVKRNRDFHHYLASLTQNPYFSNTMERILELIEWAALNVKNRVRRPQQAVQEHKSIYKALKENDANKAREAMEAHLSITKKLARNELDITH
jgi:DNA-binding GntR family transcriptional regulator